MCFVIAKQCALSGFLTRGEESVSHIVRAHAKAAEYMQKCDTNHSMHIHSVMSGGTRTY